MPVTIIDIAIIVAYFIVLLIIGYLTSRRVRNMEDYAVAGRGLGYPALLGTLIGTTIGAGSTMGKAGKAFDVGAAFFFASMGYAIGLFIFAFIAPVIRRMSIWTIPEALVLRYGPRIRLVTALVMILGVVALFGGQLVAVGVAVSTTLGGFGVSYTQAVLVAGTVMVVYTFMGGLLAVAYTDLLQTIIFLIGVGILLPIFVVGEIGGVKAAVEVMTPPEGNFWGGLTPAYIISIFLIDIPFCLIDPSLWQRASAARDPGMIKRSMFVTGGVYLYWSLIVVFLGVAAIRLFPGLAPGSGDSVIPLEVANHLPPIVTGLCVAAMLAIMMSTASTALLISGTTFSQDIVKAFRPASGDKKLLLITRLFIIFIGAAGILFALGMRGIFDILLLAFAIFVSGIFIPAMAAIFWKKATAAGAISSALAASVTVVALYGLKLGGMLPTWIEPIIASLTVSLIVMIVVSRATWREETGTPKLYSGKNA